MLKVIKAQLWWLIPSRYKNHFLGWSVLIRIYNSETAWASLCYLLLVERGAAAYTADE